MLRRNAFGRGRIPKIDLDRVCMWSQDLGRNLYFLFYIRKARPGVACHEGRRRGRFIYLNDTRMGIHVDRSARFKSD